MKKRINVTIYKNGSASSYLLTAIGNMNDGMGVISVRDLEGYLIVRNLIYPNAKDGELFPTNEPNTYCLSEDKGKTFTMKIEFAETQELAHIDDLKNTL